MRHRVFGSTGKQVSVIGQGTWNMEKDRRAAVEALGRGLDLGMTHVDTAEMYGDGKVEELVGEAIADRRGEVFLVSTVLPSNASRRGAVQGPTSAPPFNAVCVSTACVRPNPGCRPPISSR